MGTKLSEIKLIMRKQNTSKKKSTFFVEIVKLFFSLLVRRETGGHRESIQQRPKTR